MELTDEEIEIINKKREEQSDGITRRGTLKYDLYYLAERYPEIRIGLGDIIAVHGWYFEEKVKSMIMERVIEYINESCSISIKQGTPFVKFGNDGWYDDDDDGIGIEGMDDEWAEKHLEIMDNE